MAKRPLLALAVLLLGAGGLTLQPGLEETPAGLAGLVLEAPPPEEVDAAVERGLRFLAEHREPGGCWTGDVGHKRGDGYVIFHTQDEQRRQGAGHAGITALAGLAFLANGHVPDRGPRSEILDRVIDYLLRCSPDYDFIADGGTRMYSHSFAVLFLSQVQGMTRRRQVEVAERLRQAVRFIEKAQNRHGAWRYQPFTDEADLSVTVCQVQALRAARNAGVRVSRSTIDRVLDYLRRSRIPSGPLEGAFYYKIHGRAAYTKTSFAINAAAVTALHSAGVYDERHYGKALAVVEEEYDQVSRFHPHHFYFWYGNYYAAQALHLEGGTRWERYWARLARDLLQRQEPDGRWQNDVGPGDSFATAVACLLLRIPLGYLPIFRS